MNKKNYIPPNFQPKIIISEKDPTEKDVMSHSIWVSREYIPNRVFEGEEGKWRLIGKFYPVDSK